MCVCVCPNCISILIIGKRDLPSYSFLEAWTVCAADHGQFKNLLILDSVKSTKMQRKINQISACFFIKIGIRRVPYVHVSMDFFTPAWQFEVSWIPSFFTTLPHLFGIILSNLKKFNTLVQAVKICEESRQKIEHNKSVGGRASL